MADIVHQRLPIVKEEYSACQRNGPDAEYRFNFT